MQKILSIDVGRKYFSSNQLKHIISTSSKLGYTDVEILFGNDGLRLILDDMKIETRNKHYSNYDVKEALTLGNTLYYNDNEGNYLTQGEMDGILSFAKEKAVNIIPGINSPGHMTSILTSMIILGIENVKFTGSKSTVNLNNQEAVEFTQKLIEKYVRYFSGKGSKIFNLGADEYANDAQEYGGGWTGIQQSGLYKEFIAYVNQLSDRVVNKGMRPLLFNDGLYYNESADFGIFNKEIGVAYWTSGFGTMDVASPNYLMDKGHQIINTNDSWYWIIGKESDFYGLIEAKSKLHSIGINDVPGSKNIPVIGIMQAIWSDNPEKYYDSEQLEELMVIFSRRYNSEI